MQRRTCHNHDQSHAVVHFRIEFCRNGRIQICGDDFRRKTYLFLYGGYRYMERSSRYQTHLVPFSSNERNDVAYDRWYHDFGRSVRRNIHQSIDTQQNLDIHTVYSLRRENVYVFIWGDYGLKGTYQENLPRGSLWNPPSGKMVIKYMYKILYMYFAGREGFKGNRRFPLCT